MKRMKIIYYSILVIIILLVTSVYISFAFLTSKNEEHGKLNIVAGTLDYKIESEDLINNEITVEAGQAKKILIKLTSLNSIDSKYELYYTLNNENEDVEVGYSSATSDSISGTIDANGVKKITVIIRNNSDTNTTVTFNAIGGLEKYELVLNQGNSLNQEITLYSCEYTPGTEFVFDYTGSPEEFTVPCSGTYKLETWGAQGGSYCYSYGYNLGSYTAGNIFLNKNQQLYVYVGQSTNTRGVQAYNGGGIGYASNYSASYAETGAFSGGGATDIRLVDGNWNDFDSLKSRIIVAAGAGGSATSGPTRDCSSNNSVEGRSGGGLVGINNLNLIFGGTQTSSGYCSNSNYCGVGSFGIGGNSIVNYHANGGGGGGYYGGAADRSEYKIATSGLKGGSSGSSFISGHNGCDAIKESSTSSNIVHTGQSIHYSGLYFTDTVMVDGDGNNWTTEQGDYTGMPSRDGTSIIKGNSGNGYAKITYLGD